MNEGKNVYTEIWPLAADEDRLWLLSENGAWINRLPVPTASTVHAEVELQLAQNGISGSDVVLLHSPSWREDPPFVVLTYFAVVSRPGPIRRHWPQAEPISPRLLEAVGKPQPHGATEPPTIRDVDVMVHAIRHIRFLWEYDATAASVLNANWIRHVSVLRPALAGLYSQVCNT